MRDDKPGDLSVRLSFGRVIGNGPDDGKIRPSLHIADGTSGRNLEIELTPAQLTEMLSGGAAQVTADKVRGFRGVQDWGKYHKIVTEYVPVASGEQYDASPYDLDHVAEAVRRIEAQGYVIDRPRRNNRRQWVIIGRRYDEQP